MAGCEAAVWAQTPTAVDLRTQTKDVDFSSALSTKPMQAGSALPGTCSVGAMFYLTVAAAGSNLYACTTANTWTVETGAGAQTVSQLSDLTPRWTSSTVLTLGASCSPATPCNVRFGATTYAFTASTSVTISAGSGTAYIYLDPSGNLTVGHNLTVSCSTGCVAVAGIAAFPASAIPLFTWTATNGAWNAGGGTDWRSFQSATDLAAGAGLLSSTANGVTTLSVDPTQIGLWTPAPATSSSACAKGTWSIDTSYYYLCVAANTWKRAALSTW
jgi:hypothetical protein